MRLNLGCGPNKLDGWENLDLIYGHDLTRPLKYPDESIDEIFSEHFIEHLTKSQQIALFKECKRVLKPTGVMWISTPDLKEMCVYVIYNNYLDHVKMFNGSWCPETESDYMNEGMRSWGHQYLWMSYDLQDQLVSLGFYTRFVNEIPHVTRPNTFETYIKCKPFAQAPLTSNQ